MNQIPEALPPESFPQDGSFNQVMLWYEKQPWIRAMVQAIPVATYRKGLADLERLGFIRFDNTGIGKLGGGGGGWKTTEYLAIFKQAFRQERQ
nr:hypothetical protein [Nitrospirota bacterium]